MSARILTGLLAIILAFAPACKSKIKDNLIATPVSASCYDGLTRITAEDKKGNPYIIYNLAGDSSNSRIKEAIENQEEVSFNGYFYRSPLNDTIQMRAYEVEIGENKK